MADSSREAGQQSCARTCPQTCPQGCSETGRIAWGQTALILKPPQARGASSAWPIRGIMERCRAPGMAKNSLYRGLPSRCQNPGCISRYICKFVAKRPAGICLPATEQALCVNEQQAGVRASARRLPDESKYPGLPCFGVQLCIPRRRSRHSSWPPTPHLPRPWRTGFGPCRGSGSGIPCPSTPRPTRAQSPRPTAKSKPRCGRLFRSSTPSTAFWRRVWRAAGRGGIRVVAGPHRRHARLHFRQSCGAPCWRCCTEASRCWA